MESILSHARKIVVDTRGGAGGNMIYLPLDKLMDAGPRLPQAGAAGATVAAPAAAAAAAGATAAGADEREREQRTRESR
jgi:membrane protease subunit HflK